MFLECTWVQGSYWQRCKTVMVNEFGKTTVCTVVPVTYGGGSCTSWCCFPELAGWMYTWTPGLVWAWSPALLKKHCPTPAVPLWTPSCTDSYCCLGPILVFVLSTVPGQTSFFLLTSWFIKYICVDYLSHVLTTFFFVMFLATDPNSALDLWKLEPRVRICNG